jgi:hypothetical protein
MGHSGATQLLDVVGIVATTRTGLHLSWMLSCTYETWLSTDGWGFGSWSGNREGRVRLIGSDSSNCTGLSYRRVVCRSTQVCTHKNAIPHTGMVWVKSTQWTHTIFLQYLYLCYQVALLHRSFLGLWYPCPIAISKFFHPKSIPVPGASERNPGGGGLGLHPRQ